MRKWILKPLALLSIPILLYVPILLLSQKKNEVDYYMPEHDRSQNVRIDDLERKTNSIREQQIVNTEAISELKKKVDDHMSATSPQELRLGKVEDKINWLLGLATIAVGIAGWITLKVREYEIRELQHLSERYGVKPVMPPEGEIK